MATQVLDTELDVCRKYLHFSQRDLFFERFANNPWEPDEKIISYCFKKVKYWRIRYNAACAVEQAREAEISHYA